MSGIRSKDTKPEIMIRKALFAQGFRYRLHVKGLPGKPDIVLPKYRAVILVHGCFWHGHDCHLFTWPKSREEFWREKIGRNREVDGLACQQLRAQGWRVLTVWECALKGKARLPFEEVTTAIAEWLRGDDLMLNVQGVRTD